MKRRLAMLAVGLMATVTHAQVPQLERSTLLHLYDASGGHQWANNDGWLGEPGTECEWYGVVCESVGAQQRVRGLHLSFNDLEGRLPDDLGKLSELERLLVAGNELTGPLPSDLWSLERLESLAIFDNAFTGAIPDRLLTLPGDSLDLSDNHFDGYLTGNTPLPAGEKTSLILANNLLSTLPPPEWRQGIGFDRLDLSGNRLAGTIDASVLPDELIVLDLSGNSVTDLTGLDGIDGSRFRSLRASNNRIATWPEALAEHPIETLDLSHNRLSDPIPAWIGDLPLIALDVSSNRITGALPVALSNLDLADLDISDNRLTGTLDTAVAAMGLNIRVRIDASSNRLSGDLPQSLMELRLLRADIPREASEIQPVSAPFQPGLNLCWNDFDQPDEALAAFIDEHHFAGSYTGCIQDRLPIEATLSGSWFNPDRSGEGIVQHLLDNGKALLFWFTFPAQGESFTAEQRWYLRVVDPENGTVHYDGLHQTQGRFGDGGTARLNPDFHLRTSRPGENRQQFSYSYGFHSGGSISIRTVAILSDQYEQVPLTRLAGTRCDNRQPHQWISGAWYNPERSGEGFVIDVNEDGRVVVYWFTHVPSDLKDQAWMIGTGEFAQNQVRIEEMIRPVGTQFGDDFEPTQIELIDWGRLTLTFDDDDSGQISYDSHLPEFGSGSYPIERLARPMLAECEQEAGE